MKKVAVIGDKASVLAFRALGVEVFSPADATQARNLIDQLARNDYGVIYLTERIAAEVEKTIARYQKETVPAIILIPDSEGTLGLGMQKITENVEKAVGMSIF